MAQPEMDEHGFAPTPDETGTANVVWRMQFVVSHKVFTTWSQVKTEKSFDDAQVAEFLIHCYKHQAKPHVCPTCRSPLTLLCSKCLTEKQETQQTLFSLSKSECTGEDQESIVSKQQLPVTDLKVETYFIESCSEIADVNSNDDDDSNDEAPQRQVKNKEARLEHSAKVFDSTDKIMKCGYNKADDIQRRFFYGRRLRQRFGRPSYLAASNDVKDQNAVDTSCKQRLKLKRGRPRKLVKTGNTETLQDTSIAHTEGKGFPSYLASSNDAKEKDAVLDSSCKPGLKLKRGRPRKLVKTGDTEIQQDETIALIEGKGFQCIGQENSGASIKDSNRKTRIRKKNEHSVQCNICGRYFKYQGALDTHNKKHTQSDIMTKGSTYSLNPPRCKICCKNFNHCGLLVTHMRTHEQTLSSILGRSGYDEFLKSIYHGCVEKHKRKHHQHLWSSNDDLGSTILLPDIPDKDGKSGSDSIKDATALEQEPVKCASSNTNSPDYDEDANLSSASSVDDSEATFSLSNYGDVRGYTCGVCGRWFLRLAVMAVHALRHDQTAGNPFCCRRCQKGFLTMPEFTGHLCELPASKDQPPQKPEEPNSVEHTSQRPVEGPEQLCGASLSHIALQGQSRSPDLKVHDHLKRENMDRQTQQSLQTSGSDSQLTAVHDPTNDTETKSDSNKHPLESDPVNSSLSEPSPEGKKRRKPKMKKTPPKEWELKELDRRFKCSKCPAEFMFASGLKKHFQKHTGINAYPCPQCDKTFTSSRKLITHQEKTHWGADPITCQECKKQFKTQQGLDMHLPLHSEKPSFQCSVCQKWFKTQPLLSYHFKKLHKIHTNYRCGHCDKMFPSKWAYENHLTSHTGFRDHLCSHCGEVFPTKQHLTRHALKHGPKQWVCEHCGKGFYDKYSYTKHKAIHMKVRPYPCPESSCNLRFLKPYLCKNHYERVHLHDRPFKCTDCGACYPNKYRLNEHIRSKHTFERPFKCSLCPKRFAKYDCRKQHQKSHKVDKIFIVQEVKDRCCSSSDIKSTNA